MWSFSVALIQVIISGPSGRLQDSNNGILYVQYSTVYYNKTSVGNMSQLQTCIFEWFWKVKEVHTSISQHTYSCMLVENVKVMHERLSRMACIPTVLNGCVCLCRHTAFVTLLHEECFMYKVVLLWFENLHSREAITLKSMCVTKHSCIRPYWKWYDVTLSCIVHLLFYQSTTVATVCW